MKRNVQSHVNVEEICQAWKISCYMMPFMYSLKIGKPNSQRNGFGTVQILFGTLSMQINGCGALDMLRQVSKSQFPHLAYKTLNTMSFILKKKPWKIVVLVIRIPNSDIQVSFEVHYSKIQQKFLNLLLQVFIMSPVTYIFLLSSFPLPILLAIPPPTLFFLIPFSQCFHLRYFLSFCDSVRHTPTMVHSKPLSTQRELTEIFSIFHSLSVSLSCSPHEQSLVFLCYSPMQIQGTSVLWHRYFTACKER